MADLGSGISTNQAWLGQQSIRIYLSGQSAAVLYGVTVRLSSEASTSYFNIPLRPGRKYLVPIALYLATTAAKSGYLRVQLVTASGSIFRDLDLSGLATGTWHRIAAELDASANSSQAGMLQLQWKSDEATDLTGQEIDLYVDAAELLDKTDRPELTESDFPFDFIPPQGSLLGSVGLDGGASLQSVDGDPESAVAALPGSLAANYTDGRLHLKETGTGNTGWDAVATEGYADAGAALAESNANDYTDAAVLSAPVSLIKTADEPRTTTTTFANDATFSFAAAASKVYVMRLSLHVAISGGAANFKFQFTGPAGTTVLGLWRSYYSGNWQQAPTQFTALSSSQSLTVGTTNTNVLIDVYFATGGTAGTVHLQWAQVTSAGTTTIKKGSSALLTHS